MNLLVERWRAIVKEPEKSWVLFGYGTCVILVEPEDDLAAQATELLKVWGPVQVATPSADFSVIEPAGAPGWIVTCHHRDILTYVSPDEFPSPGPNEIMIGLLGRFKRDRDARDLGIIHVEDKRTANSELESPGVCACLVTPANHLVPSRELGMDRHYAEVSILVCRDCGQHWLRYFYEVEAFSGSGRWYIGPISEEQAAALDGGSAKSILEGLDWYYFGGSYFGGRNGKISGPIYLNP